MRKAAFILAMGTWLLAGCGTMSHQTMVKDPIDQLVAKLSADDMWRDGYFMPIDLPPTARPEDVATRALHPKGMPRWVPAVRTEQIVKVRRLEIGSGADSDYTAVLVDTNLGQKIVLLKYEGLIKAWWYRTYDVSEDGMIEVLSGPGKRCRS